MTQDDDDYPSDFLLDETDEHGTMSGDTTDADDDSNVATGALESDDDATTIRATATRMTTISAQHRPRTTNPITRRLHRKNTQGWIATINPGATVIVRRHWRT